MALFDDGADTGLDHWLIRDMPIVPISKGKNGLCPVATADLIEFCAPDIAYLERVHAMKGQGVSSCFNFGTGFGIIQGALSAKRVPFHLITPQEWKKHHRLGRDKGAARGMASRLFPSEAHLFSRVKDDGRAEAALIAAFGFACVSTNSRTTR